MLNLSIKNVPESLAARLRERAARHHRSLQGELMLIIEQAVAEQTEPVETRAVATRGTRTIEQIAAEHRRRFPQAITTGPLAVDILRADRDAR